MLTRPLSREREYLVSRDLDLLDLMKDETFRALYPGLLILEPVAFLRHRLLQTS